MTSQPRVVKVRGNLKDYPWGLENGLAEFNVSKNDQPQAELWFGNHPAGPSFKTETGEQVANQPEFPLLVKLLAIGKPLSVQVHPDQKFAQANFEKLKLSDKNGKDEILIALDKVWAFAGIKTSAERLKIAKNINLISCDLDFVNQCREIFQLSSSALEEKIADLIASLPEGTEKSVFENLKENYPHDPGVLVASLLEFHELNPGEGLHVPPGCPHEYLRGLAVEVMTNSDNVFRMGLTNKIIDRENSLKVLNNSSIQKFSSGDTYQPRAKFEVKLLNNVSYEVNNHDYQVLLCLSGEAVFEFEEVKYRLTPGEALLLSGEITGNLTVRGRVTVAIHQEDGRL